MPKVKSIYRSGGFEIACGFCRGELQFSKKQYDKYFKPLPRLARLELFVAQLHPHRPRRRFLIFHFVF
jgi:hypothetical protein